MSWKGKEAHSVNLTSAHYVVINTLCWRLASSQSSSWILGNTDALRATSIPDPKEDDRLVKMSELVEGQPHNSRTWAFGSVNQGKRFK